MTIDYKALAERIERLADDHDLYATQSGTDEAASNCHRIAADLRTVASLLEGMVEETAIPAPFMHLLGHAYGLSLGTDWNRGTHAEHYRRPLLDAVSECKRWLDSAPQPQPERQPVSEPTDAHPMLCATHYCKDCAALWRQCDDFSFTLRSQACCTACNNAPVGGQLFALTTPVAMPRPSEPTEAQIDEINERLAKEAR